MTMLVLVLGALVAWSLLALPVAVAIGRAFRAGEEDVAFEPGPLAAVEA